jgi:nicotinamidase-related amidase
VENLLVTGVCTDICVTSTVQHARNLDFRCYVLGDAVAGTSKERHEAALLCLGHVFGYVISLAEAEKELV